MKLPDYFQKVKQQIHYYNNDAKLTWLVNERTFSIRLQVEVNNQKWFIKRQASGDYFCYRYDIEEVKCFYSKNDTNCATDIGLFFGKESLIINEVHTSYGEQE